MQHSMDFSFPNTPSRRQQQPAHRHSRTPSQISLTTSSSQSTVSSNHSKSSRPSSHHRRNSSVSTRRESAEIMGITGLDNAQSDVGDTAQIRQRALWALEGKGNALPSFQSLSMSTSSTNFGNGYAKVEIPEWTTPDVEKPDFTWSDSGSTSAKPNVSALVGKRDGFGKTLSLQPSASSKLELHTLLEEDEDEEDDVFQLTEEPQALAEQDRSWETDETEAFDPTSIGTSTPRFPLVVPPTPSPVANRPRPPTLHLRPLSLVAALPVNTQAPSPSISHSPRISGLKSLTFSGSTSPPVNHAPARRLSNGLAPSSPSPNPQPHRRSSILYRRSSDISAYPQRSMSPSTDSSPSTSSSEIFLTGALLSRIASLEAALSSRPDSMSLPLTPDTALSTHASVGLKSSHSPSTSVNNTSDELMTLVANLKGERDELNSDVQGWRARCLDLQRATDTIKRQLAEDRRELWVARDRVGGLESEVQMRNDEVARLTDDVASRDAGLRIMESALANKEESLRHMNEQILAHYATIQSLEADLNSERAALAGETLRSEGLRLATLKEKRAWEAERLAWMEERRLFDDQLRKSERKIKELEDRLAHSQDGMKTPRARSVAYNTSTSTSFKTPTISPLNFKFPMGPATPRLSDQFAPEEAVPEEAAPYPYSYSLTSSNQPSTPAPLKAPGFGAGFKFGGGSPSPPISGSTSSFSSSNGSPVVEHFHGPLDVVAEEEEDQEEDALKHYEDEDEEFESAANGSDEEFDDSEDDRVRIPIRVPTLAAPVVLAPSVTPKHAHRRSASMVQNWKFPSPKSMVVISNKPVKPVEDEDFFACLQDESATPAIEVPKKERKRLPSGCPAFWLDFDEPSVVAEEDTTITPDYMSSSSSNLDTVQEEDTTASEMEDSTAYDDESEGPSFCSTPVCEDSVSVVKTSEGLPVLNLSFEDAQSKDGFAMSLSAPIITVNNPSSITSLVFQPELFTSSAPSAPTISLATSYQFAPLQAPTSFKSRTPARPLSPPTSVRYDDSITTTTTTRPPTSVAAMTVPHIDTIPATVAKVAPAVSFASRLSLQTLSSIMSWSPKAAKAPLCVASEGDLDAEDEEEIRQLLEKRELKARSGLHASTVARPLPPSTRTLDASQYKPYPSSSTPSPAKVKTKHVDPTVMRERLRVQLEREGRLAAGKERGETTVRRSWSLRSDSSDVSARSSKVSSQGPCFRCSKTELLEL